VTTEVGAPPAAEAPGAAPRDRGHLALLSLGALGVVYGDIGTSPLYAFREAIHATGGRAADEAGILGILSLIVWSLIAVVSVKYLAIVVRADNHGEGGILALTALLRPAALVTRRRRMVLVAFGIFGTALLYGDGIITPAISVLAAVEGVRLVAPGLDAWVLPLAIAILVALFAVQHLGTAKVGAVFGPVMITWFAVLASLGAWQVVRDPSVVRAVDPRYALRFAADRPGVAFLALGGVFLVVTGAEALYADMGHFGRRPIRLGWFTIVLPALLLNYAGQGAMLLADPDAASDPFFLMAPGWALLPLVVLATLATVIASQALISGAFSITMQAISLGYLPRVRIDHTSPREFGQVYLPAVNATLMVACVALVLAFRSSTALAAAYGIAVTSTMIITTLLLLAVARERWRWSVPVVVTVGAVLLAIDLGFLTANATKIAAGGWFPLVIGAAIFTVMTTWATGRRHVTARRRLGTQPLAEVVDGLVRTAPVRVPGTAVYLGADLGQTPTSLETNLATHHVLHERIIVLTVRFSDTARVPSRDRAEVHDLGAGVHEVLLRYGFMEEPDVPTALRRAVPPALRAQLADATYFLGRETIVATELPGMRLWRERLFVLLHRNAASAVRYFRLPRDRIVEVGTIIEI
jgi:KUP system potassium uptake protein